MAEGTGNYDVGYGKPPKGTRFVKGQSGNRKGRPKGSKNLDTIVNKVGRQRVRVTGNNGSRSITKLEASVTQLINKAAAGDLRAINQLVNLQRICEESERATGPPPLFEERDKAVMDSILKRIRQAESEPKATAETNSEESETKK